mgnify:CR=1 FL=1
MREGITPMNNLDELSLEHLQEIRAELDLYLKQRLEVHTARTPFLQEARAQKCQTSPFESTMAVASMRPSANAPVEDLRIPDFLRREKKHQELDRVLENKAESFSEMLLRLIDERGMKDSEVYKNANIDRRLFSKIRGDEDYLPSKKTAISFCLALQLGIDEAKKLLAAAGYTLSMSSRFDLIIMYLIENCEYNVHFANIVLDDYGEGTLSR